MSRNKRKRKEMVDLDITSLLDILVILIFFLILNFNSSGVVVNVPKGIDLPKSTSITPNTSGVIVQVSPTTIWVDDVVILETANLPSNAYDHGGRRIVPLFNELIKKKEIAETINKNIANPVPFSGIVNLVIDKSLKYNYLQKLMYTCAEAGFKRYKFVVMGEQ